MFDKDGNKGPIAHHSYDEDNGKHKRDDICLRAATVGHKVLSAIPIVVAVAIVVPVGAISLPVFISIRELLFISDPVDQDVIFCEIHYDGLSTVLSTR